MKTPTTYGKRGGLKDFDRGSRKISHAYGKSALLTYGLKAEGGVAVESESERFVAHMLNIDPEVVSYTTQPFAVELTTGELAFTEEDKNALRARARKHGGKAVFYTPDFGIVWSSGVQCVVEVKLENFLGDAEYQRKLKLAEAILLSHGYEFLLVVMPSSWRHPFRTNLPLLHQAHLRRDIWPGPDIAERILQIHERGASTMGEYLTGLGLDSRMSPPLLVCGHLQADLVGQALCFATLTAPAYGALDHLQFIRRLVP